MKLLIDADIVTFRAAFSAEEEPEAWIACGRADNMIEEMIGFLGTPDVELWLSGKDNFRYSIYPEYKANRITAKRPKYEQEVKKYLVDTWGAEWSEGCEADDMLGVRCTEIGPQSTICTIDKDLDMIPGYHYNFVKKERYFQTPEQASYCFYYQCLVGDTADGIKGVPGIGPVKAKRILDGCDSEEGMYQATVNQFSCYEEFEMTAKVLWIWRTMGGIWKDPFKN